MNGPEKALQTSILGFAGALPYVRLWRANVGVARPLSDPRAVVRFGVKGQADLSGLLRCGKRLEVEVKAPGQRIKPGSDQDRFGAMVRAFNGLHLEADNLGMVIHELEQHRLVCPTCSMATHWSPTC